MAILAMRKMPPGFRFHPTDVELMKFYLKRKVLGKKFECEAIAEVDIYKYPPWDLPDKAACLPSKDLKWFFFCPRERKYASGARLNRATEGGYWKTTGKDRPVNYNGEVVGTIKTLVFHIGRAPKGDRTDWVMHEYTLKEKGLEDRGVVQDSYVLCMVFQKEGPGPRNGAQYGAPFVEEDWTDDEKDSCLEMDTSVPNIHHAVSSRILEQPVSGNDAGLPMASGSHAPESVGIGSSPGSCVFDTAPSSSKMPLSPNGQLPLDELPVNNEDDILSLLDWFVEGDPIEVNEEDKNEDTNNPEHNGAAEQAVGSDDVDIFTGLEDLGEGKHTASLSIDDIFSDMDNVMELRDLDTPLSCSGGAHTVVPNNSHSEINYATDGSENHENGGLTN